jgi:AcrR family transcriptional regulator
MSRWEPDARGRLEQAAWALFGERGYEQTTVAEIAARAGVTERTFFRQFADKREVLFSGAGELREAMINGLAQTPEAAAPIDAIAGALDAAAAAMGERSPDFARQRAAIINANADLQERELIKLAGLASALAETLRARGVKEPAASLTAAAGIAVFRVAFASWIDEGNHTNFAQLMRESLAELKAVTAGR